MSKADENVKPPGGEKITSGRKKRFAMTKRKCCHGERGCVYTLFNFIENKVLLS